MRFHCGFSFNWKTLKKWIIPIIVGVLLYFAQNLTVSALECPNANICYYQSGDSVKDFFYTATNKLIGSNYYYQFSPNTWYDTKFTGSFELGTDLPVSTNGSDIYVNFALDYCVNGGVPEFTIKDSLYNYVDYTYKTNTSIYLSNGEWSKASCYRSFIRLKLKYVKSLASTPTTSFGTTQDMNIVFSLKGNDSFDKLLRYTDLIYLSERDYTSMLNELKTLNKQDEIINNQNDNTQAIIDSNKVCKHIDKNSCISNGYLVSDGTIWGSSQNSCVTDYLNVVGANLSFFTTPTTNDFFCFYNINKTKISCTSYNGLSGSISIPSEATYFRSTINVSNNRPTYNYCVNGNQAVSDSITDDSVNVGSSGSAYFGDNVWLKNYGLSSFITIPMEFIQGITSTTCEPLTLYLPYTENESLELPCISTIFSTNFSTLYSMYQIIMGGLISFYCGMKIFKDIEVAVNPYKDMPVSQMFT